MELTVQTTLSCKQKKQDGTSLNKSNDIHELKSKQLPEVKHSMQSIIKTEVDEDYKLYLAKLKAKRDYNCLIEERNKLIDNIKKEQALNIELRKDICAFEKELFIMIHRNSHKSCIIDGLQEVDEKAKATHVLNSEMQQSLSLKKQAQRSTENIIKELRHDIYLLRKKTETDNQLLNVLQPHRKKLKNHLDLLCLEAHQEFDKCLQDLEEKLKLFEVLHSEVDALIREFNKEKCSIEQLFHEETDSTNSVPEKQGNPATSNENKRELEVTTEAETTTLDEDFKNTVTKLITEAELFENESVTFASLLLPQFIRIKDLMSAILSENIKLYDRKFQNYLIKEYIEILSLVKKKQESTYVQTDDSKGPFINALNIKLSIQEEIGAFLLKVLNQFFVGCGDAYQIDLVKCHDIKKRFIDQL